MTGGGSLRALAALAMLLTLITAPNAEPVTLVEAKKQLEIPLSDTSDDELITELIVSARLDVEAATRRVFITQVWELQLDAFSAEDCPIEIPLPPLQSIASVKYIDSAGAEQTWSALEYVVGAAAGPRPLPGSLWPAYGKSYPSARDERNAVRIRFTAGYGNAAAVPAGLKSAIKLVIAELHQHRDPRLIRKSVDTLDLSYEPAECVITPAVRRVIAPYWLPAVAA